MAKKVAKKASRGAKKAPRESTPSKKKQLYTVSALSKSGAVRLAKTYRDKIGAKIHGDVFEEEKTGLWQFKIELPFE